MVARPDENDLEQPQVEKKSLFADLPPDMILGDWQALVIKDSQQEAQQNQDAITEFDEKRLIAKMNSFFMDIAAAEQKKPNNTGLRASLSMDLRAIALKGADDSMEKKDLKFTKAMLFRPSAVVPSAAARNHEEGLSYFGKVVSERVGYLLPRATTMPLGDNNGKGPKLYLDGSSVTNVVMEGSCLAWQCRVPKVKKDVKDMSANDDSCPDPPAKVAKSNKGQRRSSESRSAPVLALVPTHQLIKVPFEVAIRRGNSTDDETFHYERPVLVDIDTPESQILRCSEQWDEEDSARVRREAKAAKTFAVK